MATSILPLSFHFLYTAERVIIVIISWLVRLMRESSSLPHLYITLIRVKYHRLYSVKLLAYLLVVLVYTYQVLVLATHRLVLFTHRKSCLFKKHFQHIRSVGRPMSPATNNSIYWCVIRSSLNKSNVLVSSIPGYLYYIRDNYSEYTSWR